MKGRFQVTVGIVWNRSRSLIVVEDADKLVTFNGERKALHVLEENYRK